MERQEKDKLVNKRCELNIYNYVIQYYLYINLNGLFSSMNLDCTNIDENDVNGLVTKLSLRL